MHIHYLMRSAITGTWLLIVTFNVQSAQVTVRKTAAEANPTLCLAEFDGPVTARETLSRTLKRCNWFTVVDQPNAAAYRLRAAYRDGEQPGMAIVVTRGGQQVATLQVTVPDGSLNWLTYRAVDELIEKVFGNPGLCSSRIAFVVGNGRTKEVFTCNFDGTEPSRITHNGTISTEPSWGADSERLVYTLYSSGRTHIAMIALKQQRQRVLTSFPGLNAAAALAPDRQRAALCLSRDKRVELYTMDLTGRDLNRLTNDVAVESSPCWSPDGRTICYVSDKAGRPQLYLMPAGGGRSRRVLNDANEMVSPDWSAVSNKICFSMRRNGQYVIGVTDAKGGGALEVVTEGSGDWESPSWAPDGRHVVCSRQLGNQRELCMVDTRTGRVIRVTKPGNVSLPSWSGRMRRKVGP